MSQNDRQQKVGDLFSHIFSQAEPEIVDFARQLGVDGENARTELNEDQKFKLVHIAFQGVGVEVSNG